MGAATIPCLSVRRGNSLLEWYGGGAVPPMIAFSGASMGNCRRYSALAVPIQNNSALAVPSYFFIVTKKVKK